MPHDWFLYAVDTKIDLNYQLNCLQSVIEASVNIDSSEVLQEHDADDDKYLKWEIQIESKDSICQLIMFEKLEQEVPAVLSFSGDKALCNTILEWLKEEAGVVLYGLKINSELMIAAADSFLLVNKMRSSSFCRTKLLFEVTTYNKNLRNIEIELDHDTISTFATNVKENILSEAAVPFVYQKTGMIVSKLNLSMIILTGVARITKESINIFSDTLDNQVLITIFQKAQFK